MHQATISILFFLSITVTISHVLSLTMPSITSAIDVIFLTFDPSRKFNDMRNKCFTVSIHECFKKRIVWVVTECQNALERKIHNYLCKYIHAFGEIWFARNFLTVQTRVARNEGLCCKEIFPANQIFSGKVGVSWYILRRKLKISSVSVHCKHSCYSSTIEDIKIH